MMTVRQSLAAAITLLLITAIPTPAIYGQGPIAKYSFNNTPDDVSGNNNHGVIHGNIKPAMDRFGNHCGAYYFDGSGYIEVPNSTSLESPTSAITITCWYRLSKRTNNHWLTILCKGKSNDERPDNPQYRLQVQQNSTLMVNTCSNGQATTSSTISMNTDFTECDNQFSGHAIRSFEWAFYSLVYDGNKVVAYMNDKKVFEFPYTQPLQRNTTSLFIGLDEPGVTEYFEGSLDDVSIYNRALSEPELLQVYNEQGPGKSDQEEFTATLLTNKLVALPANSCAAKVTFDPPKVTSSSCGKVTIVQVAGQPSGTSLTTGRHFVAFSMSSETGYVQHQGFNITVKDATAPIISAPVDTTLYIEPGNHHVSFKYREPTATDNCQLKSIARTSGLQPGDEFVTGRHVIEYTAWDESGNKSVKSFVVNVVEKKATVPPPTKTDSVKVKKDTTRQTQPVIPPKVTDPPIIKKDSAARKTPSLPPKVIDTPVRKKDTTDRKVTPQPPKVTDPPVINNDTAGKKPPPLPPKVRERENKLDSAIEVESSRLKVSIYDNATFDGDTISLYLNGRPVTSRQEVKIQATDIYIDIDSTMDNELVMFAENLGSIPPNTALLIFDDGKRQYEIKLSSSLTLNGTIRIRKKKKP